MPTSSQFQLLGSFEPSPDNLASEVESYYTSPDVTIVGMGENDHGVTFAGYGEPLLRSDALLETGIKIVDCENIFSAYFISIFLKLQLV